MKLSKNLILRGLLHAVSAVLYISLVVGIISNKALFSNNPEFLAGILVLTLLVFSVAMMGVLFFLWPILFYLDGKKKEALNLLGWTMGWFFIFILSGFLLAVFIF
ncbi:MAG: hypothetical protein V1664_05580 [Candidatus Uhrbacteria bacterium]